MKCYVVVCENQEDGEFNVIKVFKDKSKADKYCKKCQKQVADVDDGFYYIVETSFDAGVPYENRN